MVDVGLVTNYVIRNFSDEQYLRDLGKQNLVRLAKTDDIGQKVQLLNTFVTQAINANTPLRSFFPRKGLPSGSRRICRPQCLSEIKQEEREKNHIKLFRVINI